MSVSLKKKEEAFSILKNYNGNNPYIKILRRDIFELNKTEALNDFVTEYLIKNYDFEPKRINKIIKISKWFAEKKKEDWGINYVPEKILVGWLLGETDTTYHCYVKWSQTQDKAKMCFIPKNHLLDDLFVDDYLNTEIDFSKYDKMTSELESPRFLKDHQKIGVKFLLTRKKCLLADDQGLGKTATLVVGSLESNVKKVLILCPSSIKTTWKRELMFYVPESDIVVIEGFSDKTKPELEEFLGYEIGKSKKKATELLIEAKSSGKWVSGKKYTIVNYDIIADFYEIPANRTKECISNAFQSNQMLQEHFDLVIIDEIHKLSNPSSIRYKILNDFLKRCKPEYIYGVSGTPITNRPMNYYNVLKLIGDPITKDWEFFVKHYCDGKQIPAKGEKQRITAPFLQKLGLNNFWELTGEQKQALDDKINFEAKKIWITSGASNLEELRDKTRHIYLRRLKEEIPGMVSKETRELYYDLTPAQLSEYNRLWDEYQAAQYEIDSDKILNKDLMEGGLLRQYIGKLMLPKTIKLAEEYIEDGEKIMIVCCYDEEVYTLKEHFGNKAVVFNGKMTRKQKDKAEEDFMNNKDVKVFIGQIIACGVGLTLTSSRICIFNSYDWVPGNNQQVQDRIHRLTQKRDVIVFFQLFNDTISTDMWDKVMKKALNINNVIKQEIEKRTC